jgi:hypothetical protein
MQFLSAGERSLRENTHACDAGFEASDCGLPIAAGLLDRLHRQAHALLVLQGQFARGLEGALSGGAN